MDYESLGRKVKSVGWADLPSELLAIISGGLQNPLHIILFRSVCRSWRFSASPPPNILSPFLPLRFSLSPREPFSNRCPRSPTFTANAVYLLRTPTKAWMVSVQEFVAGKLVLRHALSGKEINIGPSGRKSLELSPEHWTCANQIARWYSQYTICDKCAEIARADKVAFVSEVHSVHNCANPNPQMVGFCKIRDGSKLPYAIRVGGDGGPCTITELVSNHPPCSVIVDSVELHRQIYALDIKGDVYMFDPKTSQLLLVINYPFSPDCVGDKRLLVSDGDLYMVFRSYASAGYKPRKWAIYKLVSMDQGSNVVTITRGRCKWDKVRSLGDKVMFISMKYGSFSVPARDLPPPWIANCVVFVDVPGYPCACFPKQEPIIEVYHLGRGRGLHKHPRRLIPPEDGSGMSSVQGYFDLFDPPSSWIDE